MYVGNTEGVVADCLFVPLNDYFMFVARYLQAHLTATGTEIGGQPAKIRGENRTEST
jgi:hypothetical protein